MILWMKGRLTDANDVSGRTFHFNIQAQRYIRTYYTSYPVPAVRNTKRRLWATFITHHKLRRIAFSFDDCQLIERSRYKLGNGESKEHSPEQKLALALPSFKTQV